ESLQKYGQLHPALARAADDGSFDIIDGSHRRAGLEFLGRDTIWTIVVPPEISDDDAVLMALAAQTQKRDLPPSQLGAVIIREMERRGLDQKRVAVAMGLSEATVSRCVRASKGLTNGKKKELETASTKVGGATAKVTYEDIAEARQAVQKLMKE